MFDMNDAEMPRGTDPIPDGSFAPVTMRIRKGGHDGQGDFDRGLLKPTKTPGSDVLMLDCEFTVVAGPLARRKFWQTFTVVGGKVDEHGVSIAWKISKGNFRAMIDSACGLDPQDMSEATRAKRVGALPSLPFSLTKSKRGWALKEKQRQALWRGRPHCKGGKGKTNKRHVKGRG